MATHPDCPASRACAGTIPCAAAGAAIVTMASRGAAATRQLMSGIVTEVGARSGEPVRARYTVAVHREGVMTARVWTVVVSTLLVATFSLAQDLGPHFRKIADGIYVQSAREVNSNVGIILTTEGVVLIDSGQTLIDTREVADAVKKLTPLPVRYIIDTEVHPDHTTGHFVFSPPAIVINHQGAGDAMRKAESPTRAQTLAAQSPEMAQASQGYRLVVPQIEYQQKMTLRVGERDRKSVV